MQARGLRTLLRRPAAQQGFTLIELLVVLAIIVIITTIVLSGQSLFNQSLTLTNTTYDVALSIRQAETYGISSRTFGPTANSGYGVEFSKATPSSYVFYADAYPAAGAPSNCHCSNAACAALPDAKPGNCLYDAVYGSGSSELVSQYNFGYGITVADFCGVDASSGVTHCAVAAPSDLRSVDAVFVRPNTAAIITGVDNSGASVPLSSAVIYLSASGATHCVEVTAVGQISVLPACP